MGKRAFAVVLALLLWPAGQDAAQSTGSTGLMLEVKPESRLDPQQVALQFNVPADGTSGITAQSATVVAQARALPGAAIRVTARVSSLQGPSGPVDASVLNWTGRNVGGTGGGQQAACSSGVFSSATPQDLVQGWQRSGTVTCLVNFALTVNAGLAPGVYTGALDLAIVTQ